MLKQVGGTMGDKSLDGNIPNMKLGEYRYYPQDNPNIKMMQRDWIARKVFARIMYRYFPEYIIDPEIDNSEDVKYYVGSLGINHTLKDDTSMYEPIVINKGYICVKEATSKEDGTILYLHGGVVMAYKEHYIETTSK
jgi:hypothetical protein